jgi:carbamoyltransferase
MTRYILGISAYFHDSAAALVCDGVVIAAAAEERFTRLKHDASLPVNAAKWCLDFAGIDISMVDYVVYHEKPLWKFERLIVSQLRAFPRSAEAFRRTAMTWLPEKLWIRSALVRELGIKREKVMFCDHHLSHAASAFYGSPFADAAVLTIDGVGEWATTAMYDASAGGIRQVAETRFPHSIGLFYSAFTAYLGFPVNEGEGTVMGLASYGQPRYADELGKILKLQPNGGFELDLSYFKFHFSATESFSRKLEDLLGAPRAPMSRLEITSEVGKRYADIAASVQLVTEEVVIATARDIQNRTARRNLCIAGGVGLNCVANSRLALEGIFDRVFVYPAPGDDGCAAGAALWAWNDATGGARGSAPLTVSLGRAWSDDSIDRTLREIGSTHERIDPADVARRAADDLAQGQTLGWFQGRFEWGPRALGHRSILADPRVAKTRDAVNSQVKYREDFRPFAPAVTAESANRYFDIPDGAALLTPFMLAAVPTKSGAAELMPATTHVDGSARVQTVNREESPLFHDLLSCFGEHTGQAVLLNTSFNLKGEPIVASPLQSLRTFYSSGLDTLYVGSCRVPNTSLGRNYYS